MAGQRRLKEQEILTFVLQATPEQLSNFYIKLGKKLEKRTQLANNCGIFAGKWRCSLVPS
jgi:hypothetical protein